MSTGTHGDNNGHPTGEAQGSEETGDSWRALRGPVRTSKVARNPGLESQTRPQLRPSEPLPARAKLSPHWPRPARSGPVTFLAKGRGEAEEAAGGQRCRRRRDPALARFPPGFGPGFCRMRGRHPHCHRAFHVATRRRKMADLRPCRHNNGPRQGERERTKNGGWRGGAMVSLIGGEAGLRVWPGTAEAGPALH